MGIAKIVFQIHWVDAGTGEISRRKLNHAKFIEFFALRQPARVVIEACGGAHHWARMFTGMGHQVESLPPHQVRPFVKGNKDDAADARGIWLAAQQSDIRRVPPKSAEQQAVLSLHRMRSHWVSVRTATINAMRGLLYEFGVRLPQLDTGSRLPDVSDGTKGDPGCSGRIRRQTPRYRSRFAWPRCSARR